LKWSRKFGQRAKVYPDEKEGIRRHGETPKFTDRFKAKVAL